VPPGDGVEFIGGRERRRIEVVPWDRRWPDRFERERRTIVSALGERARRVEHIGSTAVPGLAAKPIVDIQLSVADVDDDPSFVPALEDAGYILRVREPGHRMLRTAALDVHMHVCSLGSDWEERHLLFRDWLRQSADDRRRYEEVKRELARRDWPTMDDYAEAKNDVVAEITARAGAWARRTGWALDAPETVRTD
jgi:GrpB-like predicted nucleotidyltransferase (UPF0157 family)